MAHHHDEIADAGARVAAISVDSPEQHAAMVEKLQLPFPLLSDPEGKRAIRPYDVWHDGKPFARPAVIVVDTDGNEVMRQVGGEFSDRMHESELVEQLRNRDDVATDGTASPREGPVDTEQPEPGDDAIPVDALLPYFKGTRFAAIALAAREPDAKDQADRLKQQADGYLEALQALDDRA